MTPTPDAADVREAVAKCPTCGLGRGFLACVDRFHAPAPVEDEAVRAAREAFTEAALAAWEARDAEWKAFGDRGPGSKELRLATEQREGADRVERAAFDALLAARGGGKS